MSLSKSYNQDFLTLDLWRESGRKWLKLCNLGGMFLRWLSIIYTATLLHAFTTESTFKRHWLTEQINVFNRSWSAMYQRSQVGVLQIYKVSLLDQLSWWRGFFPFGIPKHIFPRGPPPICPPSNPLASIWILINSSKRKSTFPALDGARPRSLPAGSYEPPCRPRYTVKRSIFRPSTT